MKQSRDYQDRVNDALWGFIETKQGKPVVVAPVGSGKSFMIARWVLEALAKYPATKVLILCHVAELLKQIADEIFEINPMANVTFYSDKIGKKDLTGQIILGSVQSIFKKGFEIPGGIDIVVTDECHLISPNDETMYRKLFKDLETINPYMKTIGFTGTNFRPNSGVLTEGDGRLFTDVAYQIPMIELIEKGYLCPLVTPPMKTRMSVEGVGKRNGDYIDSQLQKAVDKDPITKACVDEIIEHGSDRKKWIVFTTGIEHCEHVRDEIRSRGISAEMVTGKTPTVERNAVFKGFKDGDTRCLVNVGVATTGYNNPAIDLIALMRPTRSPVLYVQMMGRALRVCEGKTDSVVLDFGSVIDTLGPVDTVDARIVNKKAGIGDGEAPIKVCPKCDGVNFAGQKFCQDCGHEFVSDQASKIETTASTGAILSTQIQPLWHTVLTTHYTRHTKNMRDSLKVTYITTGGKFYDFVCFEHTGYAREMAAKWHRLRRDTPVPNTVGEALETWYPAVARIRTIKEGKYDRVTAVEFVPDQEVQEVTPVPAMRITDAHTARLADLDDIVF